VSKFVPTQFGLNHQAHVSVTDPGQGIIHLGFYDEDGRQHGHRMSIDAAREIADELLKAADVAEAKRERALRWSTSAA
jgi:hypothetical protein